jgi:hypothetical protein
MSTLNVDKVDPSTGTALELGTSGDTITVPTGAGLTVVDEVKTNKISPATGTAFALGDSGDTFTVPSGATIVNSGTATGFGGNYSVHAIEKYVEGDEYSFTASSNYNTITDQELTITPTSTDDIIFLSGNVAGSMRATASMGQGLGLAWSTDSWVGYTSVEAQGQNRFHHTSGNDYFTQSIIATVTGLTADTAYDFRIYGMTYTAETNYFNADSTASTAGGEHMLVAIHYKYEG